MTDAWLEDLARETCLSLLRENSVGRIAVVIDEFPIVLPVNYRLVETSGVTWVAVRTRPGNVLDRVPMPVAFEIDAIDPVHRQGWSVLVRGHLQHVNPDAADFRRPVRSRTMACVRTQCLARDRTVLDHGPPAARRRVGMGVPPERLPLRREAGAGSDCTR